MIVRLLLALVADGSGHTASLAAAESRSVTSRIVRTGRSDLIDDFFDVVRVGVRVGQRLPIGGATA